MTNHEKLITEEHAELSVTHPHLRTYESITIDDRPIVGGKATNLAIMSNNGIPVPEGICVTSDVHEQYVRTGKVDAALIEELENLRSQFDGRVAVRSSANCEDGTDLSMAGVFDTHYISDPSQTISSAIHAVYDQAQSAEVQDVLALHGVSSADVKLGLVVQKLVNATQSGVLYSDINQDKYLIQYVDGLGASLVDGQEEGSSVLVDNTGEIQQSKGFKDRPLTNDILLELCGHSDSIKRLFGDHAQDVEFAVEGDEVHILQARPLTAEISEIELRETPAETLKGVQAKLYDLVSSEKSELGVGSVVFSDSNFSEILPRPKEMDLGIFAYVFTGSESVPGAIQTGRQEMGYPLGDESVGFMHFIGGKPYFSVARDAHTFYAGFPPTKEEYTQTLIAEYLEIVNDDTSRAEYPEMGLYMQDPTIEGLKARFGNKAEDYYAVYVRFRDALAEQADFFLSEYNQTHLPEELAYLDSLSHGDVPAMGVEQKLRHVFNVLEHLRNTSCVNFVKSARLGFYYSQRLQNFVKNELDLDADETENLFAKLTQGLEGSAITDANLKIAQAASLEEALAIGRRLVGHYSSGEMLEIRHPRLHEDEASLTTYVEGIYQNRQRYIEEFAKQQQERRTVEAEVIQKVRPDKVEEFEATLAKAQTYMALRETIKYYFVAEYSFIRSTLTELERDLDLNPGDIFSVYPRELTKLVSNRQRYKAYIDERRQAFNNYHLLEMPAVIREKDIANLRLASDGAETAKQMIGKLLAQGATVKDGVIVNVDNYDDTKKAMDDINTARNEGQSIILAASQINLSHDPLIVMADGIVIENAGLVSHGAQRARELGRGAIGGIKSTHLKTGDRVVFDPAMRTVTRIEE